MTEYALLKTTKNNGHGLMLMFQMGCKIKLWIKIYPQSRVVAKNIDFFAAFTLAGSLADTFLQL